MRKSCLIGYVKNDKGVEAIHCFSNDDRKNIESVLKKHYASEDKIKRLMWFGDIEKIDPDVEKCETNEYSDKENNLFFGNEMTYKWNGFAGYVDCIYLFKNNSWFYIKKPEWAMI